MKTDPSHITPQAPASSSESTPERGTPWKERLTASWRALDGQEVGIVVALLALCVLVRLLRLQPIEYYHDEVSRWNFVRQWFHENEFRDAVWTHHMARFGINVPLFFVQLLFGKHPLVYYVWPLTSFALQVLLLYLTARRVGGRAAGVLGALFLSVFTGMDRGACQLMPDAFGATAMMLVCYLMVRYQEASPSRSMRWLVGCGLAFV
jgi:hypothetical protein